jgi:hypothetical protein
MKWALATSDWEYSVRSIEEPSAPFEWNRWGSEQLAVEEQSGAALLELNG